MIEKKRLIILGAGGHARSVCDILLQDRNIQIIGLIDQDAEAGFWGIPVLGGDDRLPHILGEGMANYAFVAIGDNKLREKLQRKVSELGYQIVNAISKGAMISPKAKLGQGIAIMPGAVIGPNAQIGDGSIINTNASVDHDDQIGAYCHVAPGSTICGTVSLGNGVFVGAGARLIDRISIGEYTVIGAGAAVIINLPSYCTAVGVPAKIIKTHK